MAEFRYAATLDVAGCTGCKLCDFVCPTLAITVQDRKATIDDSRCVGCGRCVDRCPEDIMWMEPRSEPLVLTVRPDEVPAAAVAALLDAAGLPPNTSVCVCTLTPAKEIAAAIVRGARTLEEVCAATGMRAGCGIYCVAPALRLLDAAGADMTPPKFHRWYDVTLALWDLPDDVKERYADCFVGEDKRAFDPSGRYGPLTRAELEGKAQA